MRILIVAHDAGGANFLASWVKKNLKKEQFLTCLQGPAEKIFAERNFKFKNIALKQYFKNFKSKNDLILTGTSCEADLEREAIAGAKKSNIKCASFIDHWVNYRQRFLPMTSGKEQQKLINSKKWLDYLPDEIWLGDKFGCQIALKDGFPKNKLKLIKNPYFEEIKKLKPRKAKGKKETKSREKIILYLSEPIYDKWEKEFGARSPWNFTEFDHLKSTLKDLDKISERISFFIIRFHPKERKTKYDKILKKYQGRVKLIKSKNPNLIKDIKRADIIVGTESMALVAAALLGKKVFSVLPKRVKNIALPFKQIIRINSIKQIINYL